MVRAEDPQGKCPQGDRGAWGGIYTARLTPRPSSCAPYITVSCVRDGVRCAYAAPRRGVPEKPD